MFLDIPVGQEEPGLLAGFLDANDFAQNTRRAITLDIRKFARWFANANDEPFTVARTTARDVVDFKQHLRRDRGQAIATVNRSLVSLRRFYGWLLDQGRLDANPVVGVKEFRQQQLAPQGLNQSDVRRLFREIELRQDTRAAAVFHLLLYTGCRVGDLVALEINDVIIGERSGMVVFRFGKGNKQRSVPLPLPARKALQAYLETRPAVRSQHVLIGERGPLTDRGVRAICDNYSAICGVRIHPHLCRHTFAHQYLANNENDLVGLAQILGHSNLNTTRRYVELNQLQLAVASENVSY